MKTIRPLQFIISCLLVFILGVIFFPNFTLSQDTTPPNKPGKPKIMKVFIDDNLQSSKTEFSAEMFFRGSNDATATHRVQKFRRINQFVGLWQDTLFVVTPCDVPECVIVNANGVVKPSFKFTYTEDPGSTKLIRVVAMDPAGNQAVGNEKSITLQLTPSIFPGGPVNTAIEGQLLTWTPVVLGIPSPKCFIVSGPGTIDKDSCVFSWVPNPGEANFNPHLVELKAQRQIRVKLADETFVKELRKVFGTLEINVLPTETDLVAPTVSRVVEVTNPTQVGCDIRWTESFDAVGVVEYRVFGQKVGRGQSLRFKQAFPGNVLTGTLTTLESGVGTKLWVKAVDAAGNQSTISGVPSMGCLTLPAQS